MTEPKRRGRKRIHPLVIRTTPVRRVLAPEVRKEEILVAAVKAAMDIGFFAVKRGDVARYAGISQGLVSNYFRKRQDLLDAIMERAVAESRLLLIAQGVAAKNRHALAAPKELRLSAAVQLGI